MPTHITARLAWHNDGWDGSVCKNPERNTYCVGAKSFPGDVIARERNLADERRCAGCAGDALKRYVPPCNYSYNAFGLKSALAKSNPPGFFYGKADAREWDLPPSTVSVWPYEAMYDDEVKAEGFLDNDKRRELTKTFFQPVIEDCGKNLIFYYANYSNPLSEDEAPKYVLIGVSRIASVGDELFYENVQEEIAKKYAGGMVWARNISSHYPNEGLRLPYHRYLDDPERLREIAVFPENPVLCKYGSKHISDDDAIGVLEQFLAKVRLLAEFDDSEDWKGRERWLLKVIAELWRHRGLCPGLLRSLEAAGAGSLIDPVKAACAKHGHQAARTLAFAVLEQSVDNELTASLDPAAKKQLSRNWKLIESDARQLLRDVLPRLDLSAETMKTIISDARADYGLPQDAKHIAENPYLLSETFVGDSPDDRIPWSVIDRGVLPAPDVGKPLQEMAYNDERRFRALCVDALRAEPKHVFRFAGELISVINTRMARLPDWKQASFNARYFDADEAFLSECLTLKQTPHGLAVYLRTIFEDEREVERRLRDLASSPDIALTRPVTDADWKAWVYKSDSPLALKGGKAYEEAVTEQTQICARLFRRPLGVVTGPAGTGKTTIIEALVRAVRKVEGDGASLLILAPTGKAIDRAREVLEKVGLTGLSMVTVHSFLASNGWLNDNLTFKRSGGKRAPVGTLVLDEASMLDVELAAALFRAIDWPHVRRLILVGDAGQLPPISRGRMFADILRWLQQGHPESAGRLQRNLRQLLNEVQGNGRAIVALSQLFLVDEEDVSKEGHDIRTRPDQERLIEKIHVGGAVDQDLDVIYWNDSAELASILIGAIEQRMKDKAATEHERPYQLWRGALKDDPTAFQVLTPHRGELHGVEALNEACQARVAKALIERVGAVDGITVFDKVIQYRNRPRSNMIWGYDWTAKKTVQVEVFNGEIGVTNFFGKDYQKSRLRLPYGARLSRFSVKFTRKPNISVNYGKNVPAGKYSRTEKVEDNLELAYAVSVHKAQGSEFAHTFVIIPSGRGRPLSTELVYTALTRASRHCTLLIERNVGSLLEARRRENAQTPQINSSLFELHIPKQDLLQRAAWYESGKIHEALSGDMVRSKSEVIIANQLHSQEVPFLYEKLLFAGDGTMRLPDFTVTWGGKAYYWEHLGLLDQTKYADEWQQKKTWYEKWFPGQLVTTQEGAHLSQEAASLISDLKAGKTRH